MVAAWLNTSDRRKLNGFHNRCLRTIWGIKAAYYSRVSNAKVLDVTGQRPLTVLLQKQQLLLYGRVARRSDEDIMRASTFCPGTLRPATDMYIRKVGRPRLAWTSEVGKLAIQAAGGLHRLEETNQGWARLEEHCRNLIVLYSASVNAQMSECYDTWLMVPRQHCARVPMGHFAVELSYCYNRIFLCHIISVS